MVWDLGNFRMRAARNVLAATLFLVAGFAHADEYVVQPGETLWSVARGHQSAYPKASLRQIVWGLIRANPEAFPEGPGKLKRGTRLLLPSAATVSGTPTADAAQSVQMFYGKPAATPPPATAKPAAAAPVIAGVELLPAMGAELQQWFAVSGSGFTPEAKLEFFDLGKNRGFPARRPASTSGNRLEYQMRFSESPSRWRVAVLNPDGQKSAAFEFDAGRNVTVVLAPAALLQSAAVAATPARQDAPFRDSPEAKSLSAAPAERYRQLASMEDRYAGDVDYDYGYGSAAVDTGNFSQAVFPLQRAVATRPGFAGARLELARAYFGVGDNESARREFLTVRDENPPPEARRVIAEYLDAIDRRAAVYQSQLGGYLEAASGYDSNANGAPDVQNFLGINLDSRNQATDSAYYGVGAGGTLSHPFAPGWRALGDARANYRSYPDASFVDGEALRLGGGLEWRPNEFTLSVQPNFTYARLDGESNNQSLGTDFTAGFSPRDRWQLLFNARYAQQRFVNALALQDVNTILAGVAAQHFWLTFPRVQATVALTAGQDDAQSAASPFGRTLFGGRASAALDFNQGRVAFAALSSLASDFDGNFFGLPRKDQQYSLALGMDWGVYRTLGWLLRGQVSYVDNQSDISLYDYHRIDAGLSLRKEFK